MMNNQYHAKGEAQKKIAAYLSRLISYKTLPDNQEEVQKAFSWIKKVVEEWPLHVEERVYNGFHSLLLTTQSTQNPDLWLVAHIDVVAGPEGLFQARVEENKLIGRGSIDMKMAIAVYLYVLELLGNQLPCYNIGVMLVSDEEVGGFNGVCRLLADGYTSQLAFLPDGGYDWSFEEVAKGALHLTIKAKGRSAHASRPWEGENAIEKLIGFLCDLQESFDTLRKKSPDYHATLNVGKISGGLATNQVAKNAEATVDIRYTSIHDYEEIQNKLQKQAAVYGGITIKERIKVPHVQHDTSLPTFSSFAKIAEKYGKKISTTVSHGASDARFFAEKHIPVLVVAPKGQGHHSVHEWVDLEDLALFGQVLLEWVQEGFLNTKKP